MKGWLSSGAHHAIVRHRCNRLCGQRLTNPAPWHLGACQLFYISPFQASHCTPSATETLTASPIAPLNASLTTIIVVSRFERK